MMNQAAVEALYSATFAEDYLDVVENMPNEMQRHLSRLREADLAQYREFWCDLDKLVDSFESETTLSGQRQILDKIKKGLILTQDMGDEKLADISDLIESKTRLLEHDAKNLDFGKDEDEEDEEPERPPERATEKASSAKKQAGVKQSGVSSKNRASGAGHGHGDRDKDDGKAEKQSASVAAKRRKKQNEGRGGGGRGNDDRDDDEQSTASSRSNAKSRSAGGGAGGGGNGSAKKTGIASKRKSTAKANSSRRGDDKDDSDRDEIDPSNFDIDPDEPTYCLCDQVSYGDMIGCDNDLCPIEWFHFNCVQLTSKPKGKWYCPKCRGDKVTVMKPKAQFLKELEKYNKEREMKMDRHNS